MRGPYLTEVPTVSSLRACEHSPLVSVSSSFPSLCPSTDTPLPLCSCGPPPPSAHSDTHTFKQSSLFHLVPSPSPVSQQFLPPPSLFIPLPLPHASPSHHPLLLLPPLLRCPLSGST
mmetsp:Transcript_1474/g.3579  ORF Transcript_1474/g.3579 Transcript_1474/m.3579 type:complete len:117 (-) Transcript_1474:1937-2287(-)